VRESYDYMETERTMYGVLWYRVEHRAGLSDGWGGQLPGMPTLLGR